MADNDKTRVETVTDNYDEAVARHGSENYFKVWTVILQDMNVSLATLVDNAASSDADADNEET